MSTPNPTPPPAADVSTEKPKRRRSPSSTPWGRPLKINAELIAKIAETVASGCYLDTAARYNGVSKVSFHEWMKKGHEQKRGIYRDFLNALEEAQARADVRDHAQISVAASKDWKAAVTHLKLRNPGRYAVQHVEATGKDGAPLTSSVEASLLSMFTRLLGEGEAPEAPAADDAADEKP